MHPISHSELVLGMHAPCDIGLAADARVALRAFLVAIMMSTVPLFAALRSVA